MTAPMTASTRILATISESKLVEKVKGVVAELPEKTDLVPVPIDLTA